MGGSVKGERQLGRRWVGHGRRAASGVGCQRVFAPEERSRLPLFNTGAQCASHKDSAPTCGEKEASSCSRGGGNPYPAGAAQSRSFYGKDATG